MTKENARKLGLDLDVLYRCRCGVAAYGASMASHLDAKHADMTADDARRLVEREHVGDD